MNRYLWMTLLLVACEGGFWSNNEQLYFEPDGDLVASPFASFDPSVPMVEGSRLCAAIEGEGMDASCFSVGIEGPADLVDACVEPNGLGAITWTFEPESCTTDDDGELLVSDQVDLLSVGIDTVDARMVQWPEEAVESGAFEFEHPPVKGWIESGTFRIVDGGWLRLPVLLEDASGVVAWNDSRAEFAIRGDDGVSVERIEPGWLEVRAKQGARGTVTLTYASRSFDLIEVLGVADDPAEVELYVFEDEAPGGIRALVRDDAGRLIYGSQVDWSLTRGDLVLTPGGALPGPDYLLIEDKCLIGAEAEGPREAVVKARAGKKTAKATLEWDGLTGPDEVDPNCQSARGCGCQSTPSGASWLAIAVAIVVGRRRRLGRWTGGPGVRS